MLTERQIATYILYQRTGLQSLANLRLLRLLVPYKVRIALDAWMRSRTIMEQYEAVMRGEYTQITPFLPKEVENILDIGCGAAGIDALFYRTYSSTKPVTLYLADREGIDRDIYYGFWSTGSAYNSLTLSRCFLHKQGVPLEKIRMFDVDSNPLPKGIEFDLIVSLRSWGFHYPVTTYLDYVKTHLGRSGAAILDCRRGTDGLEILKSHFTVTIIDEHHKYVRVGCRHQFSIS